MGTKPSDLGALPSEWHSIKFGSVTKVRQGLQIAISDRLTSRTPTSLEYITIQSINRKTQQREYVDLPSIRVTCKADDVLMTRTGNTGIVVTGVKGAFHNNFFLIDFDRNKLDSTFLVNYLRSPRVQHVLLTKAGTSTIPDLNHKDFYSIDFPLAPLPEQKKIAAILSTWDDAISANEDLLANSRLRKKALMQQLLTGKKRLPGFEGEWEHVTLGKVADMNSGGTPKSGVTEYYGGSIPWVSISDMTAKGKWIDSTERNLTQLGLANSSARIYPENTVLYAMYASIGECCIAKVAVSSSQAILGIRPKPILSFEYLYYYLSSMKEKIKLSGQQGTQANLNAGMVKAFVFELPSIEEQQAIKLVLSTADEEIEALEQRINNLKLQKKALMQQLLTGKKRVKVDPVAA